MKFTCPWCDKRQTYCLPTYFGATNKPPESIIINCQRCGRLVKLPKKGKKFIKVTIKRKKGGRKNANPNI